MLQGLLAPTLFGASFPDGQRLLRGAGAVGLRVRRACGVAAAVAALGRRVHVASRIRPRLARARPCRARRGHRVNPPNGLFIALGPSARTMWFSAAACPLWARYYYRSALAGDCRKFAAKKHVSILRLT